MKDFEEVDTIYILESMQACKGIVILFIPPSFRQGTLAIKQMFNLCEKLIPSSIYRRSDAWTIKLENGSRFDMVPHDPLSMCGVRAHQILVREESLKDEQFINEVVRPALAWSSPRPSIFKRGLFILKDELE